MAQARAVRRRAERPERLGGFVAAAVHDKLTLLVVVAYLVGFVLHAVAVWLLPLYLAQATISLSFPVTAWLSRRVGERTDARSWGALAATTGGLVLVALSAGSAGASGPSAGLVAATWGGLIVLLVLGTVLRGAPGILLGLLSGTGYAGSAIAVRGVDWPGWPPDLLVVAAAAVVPLLGVVAFWLYSLGMHDDRVTTTTGPLVVAQTAVPAVVGILALGDGFRPGWAWAGVLGLVVATAGVVDLARGRPD